MSFIEDLKDSADKYIDAHALEELQYRVKLVLKEREELKSWTDKELKLAAMVFREDLKKGKKLDSLLVQAFAVVNEAARRVLNQTPYDVQILAGLVIHSGRVAEMKAGEGKTLTEAMPVYANALLGKGVHLITTNDYLAERDAKAMGKIYDFLGLTVGYVTSAMSNEERRKAYAADITYVSNQEIGFDYLRDHLVFSKKDKVLRQDSPLYFGIVDEIDSILIDESRTPLIIAEPVSEERNFYDLFTKIAEKLEEDKDFTVDYQKKQVSVNDEGLNKVEKFLGEPVFSESNPMYVFYLDVCLKAKVIFEKDRDYIITPDGVEIVDEFTGRVLPGRRFTDGVHQAIEAKEKVKVKDADRTQAAVTFQNFFPLYQKLSGMSGTVMRARDEFKKVYKLEVIQIPTHKPVARIDHNDLFFKTQKGKFMGLIKKIDYIHKKGQPLLVCARNVETAHLISDMLEQGNYTYQLLTAKDHKAEAEKIKNAGQPGMITVATNMAGRGTDIVLNDNVKAQGGLYVIGTERHESRRIDDQLIGRAGRQGEPGESQFLISMEDEIMQLFGSEKIIDTMEAYDLPEDEYISGESLDRAFKVAQDFVESKNLDSRLYLYKYDSVLEYQRKAIYEMREWLLEDEISFERYLNDAIDQTVNEITSLADPDFMIKELMSVFRLEAKPKEIAETFGIPIAAEKDNEINEWFNPFYQDLKQTDKFKEASKKLAGYLEKLVLKLKTDKETYQACQNLILEIIDNNWGIQLELMDVLKQGANLFSYASPDPFLDYIKESKGLFLHMQENIRRQFLTSIFTLLEQRGEIK